MVFDNLYNWYCISLLMAIDEVLKNIPWENTVSDHVQYFFPFGDDFPGVMLKYVQSTTMPFDYIADEGRVFPLVGNGSMDHKPYLPGSFLDFKGGEVVQGLVMKDSYFLSLAPQSLESLPFIDVSVDHGPRLLVARANLAKGAMDIGYFPDAGMQYGPHEHKHTDEHLVFLKGSGNFLLSDHITHYNVGSHFKIQRNVKHGVQTLEPSYVLSFQNNPLPME